MLPADPLKEALKGASTNIAAAGAAGEPDQAELFALPVADPDGRIEEARRTGSRGGRPKGAQNLATRELRAWLLSRGVLPQQAMMEWFLLGPIGLSVALSCDKAEAFQMWKDLADKLGRYFMAPMVAVDDQGKAAPTFQVFVGGSTGVVAGDGTVLPPWEYLNQQNQGVTTIEVDPSKHEEQR